MVCALLLVALELNEVCHRLIVKTTIQTRNLPQTLDRNKGRKKGVTGTSKVKRHESHPKLHTRASIVVPVLALHVADWIEIVVLQRLGRSETLLVIVSQQAVQEADGVGVCQVLILCRHELLPGGAGVSPEDRVEFAVETNAVLVQVTATKNISEERAGG